MNKNRFEIMNEISEMGYDVRKKERDVYPVINIEGIEIGVLLYNEAIERFEEYNCHVAIPQDLRIYCEGNNIDINRSGQVAYDEWKEILVYYAKFGV